VVLLALGFESTAHQLKVVTIPVSLRFDLPVVTTSEKGVKQLGCSRLMADDTSSVPVQFSKRHTLSGVSGFDFVLLFANELGFRSETFDVYFEFDNVGTHGNILI